jgi:hypothetical protein
MPEVCPAGCCQGGLQLFGPFRVGLGEPPNLAGGQAQITERRPERLTAVDRIQELLAHSGRESLLRLAPKACPRRVVLRFPAPVAVAPFQPAGQRAVCRLWAASSTIGIGKLPHFVQLLHCPWRPGNQPKGEPPRMTGGVTLHMAAAWRIEVTSCGPLTTRTVPDLHRSPRCIALPRPNPTRV